MRNSTSTSTMKLVRRVSVVRGVMRFSRRVLPAFDYGRDTHKVVELADSGAYFYSSDIILQLSASVPLQRSPGPPRRGYGSEFTLHEGQTIAFAIGEMCGECGDYLPPFSRHGKPADF